jgi:hypothetical protein
MSAIDLLSIGIGFFIGLISGAGGMMLADWFREFRNRRKLLVNTGNAPVSHSSTSNITALGFGISALQGKTLQKAYIKCNGKKYDWYVDGKHVSTAKLYVGEAPTWFYPYLLSLEYIDDLTGQKVPTISNKHLKPSKHGILFSLKDLATNAVFYSTIISMPLQKSTFKLIMNRKMMPISVTVIDDAITRPLTFTSILYLTRINVGKLTDGVPSMDTITCETTVEVPWGFFGSLSFG